VAKTNPPVVPSIGIDVENRAEAEDVEEKGRVVCPW